MEETTQAADKISGNARENIVAVMGEIAIAIDACSTATYELHAIQSRYAKALLSTLPDAERDVEAAVERVMAVYARMKEVFR